ncbi:hypothetical protein RDWZM_002333 [Blomia tropicalis]|uniref:Ribosome assembly factor mrt4 n=1 Tax=Blomia tropicalis TaxID=40697 RepID=A0A9Q0MCK4_BLOTA|nr:hypothetical protein RDWZM_002333 [Blomia tropicalis]
MPKSKRNRLVSLTATRKKGFAETKASLVNEIHECADQYARIMVFRIDNMRNAKLKELRTDLRYSRFFFGKNKVMSIGLGRTEAEEYKENLHKIVPCLNGQCGLLFTNSSKEEILKFFDSYRQKDYARTGDLATETVELYAGPLSQFSHSIEPYLRELGMPTSLQKGVVTLLKDFQFAKKEMHSLQNKHKLLEKKTAEFRVKIDAIWSNDGTFELLQKNNINENNNLNDSMSDEDGDDDDDDDDDD